MINLKFSEENEIQHIEDENPQGIIDRLNGYVLDGKPIHIQM